MTMRTEPAWSPSPPATNSNVLFCCQVGHFACNSMDSRVLCRYDHLHLCWRRSLRNDTAGSHGDCPAGKPNSCLPHRGSDGPTPREQRDRRGRSRTAIRYTNASHFAAGRYQSPGPPRGRQRWLSSLPVAVAWGALHILVGEVSACREPGRRKVRHGCSAVGVPCCNSFGLGGRAPVPGGGLRSGRGALAGPDLIGCVERPPLVKIRPLRHTASWHGPCVASL